MPSYKEFLSTLETGLRDLVRKTVKEFPKEAEQDARAFLSKSEEDLKRWTKALGGGHMSPKDFDWLVQGKAEVAKMRALKLAGWAEARIDRFRSSLLSLVVDTAVAVFLA